MSIARPKRGPTLASIRRAVANYMRSEGCGCCGDPDAHAIAAARLAKLLRVPAYDDKSGFDFARFRGKDD